MARKHMVICKYCNQKFDINTEEYVKPNVNRYAHKTCYEAHQKTKTQDEIDQEELENYIKQLLNLKTLTPKIKKQIETYHKEHNYSYSGMRLSLIYFYEVQKHGTEKSNEGIGIIPYVYAQARQYYYDIWLAQKKNENKELDTYKPRCIEIVISPPQLQPRQRNIFSFLDKEE